MASTRSLAERSAHSGAPGRSRRGRSGGRPALYTALAFARAAVAIFPVLWMALMTVEPEAVVLQRHIVRGLTMGAVKG
jgi:hypothetical protein